MQSPIFKQIFFSVCNIALFLYFTMNLSKTFFFQTQITIELTSQNYQGGWKIQRKTRFQTTLTLSQCFACCSQELCASFTAFKMVFSFSSSEHHHLLSNIAMHNYNKPEQCCSLPAYFTSILGRLYTPDNIHVRCPSTSFSFACILLVTKIHTVPGTKLVSTAIYLDCVNWS